MENEQQGVLDRILVRFVGRKPEDVPLSDEEARLLHEWLQVEENHRRFERICAGTALMELRADAAAGKDRGWEKISRQIQPGRRVITLSRWMAAAVVIGLVAVTLLYLQESQRGHKAAPVANQQQFAPGRQVATLTLGNGQQIALDQSGGQIARQGQVVITNDPGGELAYSAVADDSQQRTFNTMATPNGGHYRVTLSDGTKVWLNAASSLRFAASFGDQRQVFLQGEAYFEVAKDANRPFTVSVSTPTGEMKVQVLGTRFNVNAYTEQAGVKTTLLEGSVLVKKGQQSRKLQPGMQSVAPWGSDSISAYQYPDYQQMVSWKEGYFYFDLADMTTVAQEIARWYDLDVKVKGGRYDEQLTAHINKHQPLDSVIQILRASNVKVELQGRTLVFGQ